jgi:hypothetical protein
LRNIYDAASNPKGEVNDNTFEPLVSANDKATNESIGLRFKLLKQLGAYAGALKSLCEADLAAAIDKTSTDLDGALVGLRKTYKNASGKELKLSDDDLHLIATAVDTLGKEFVEEKRRKAVATIVETADPAVQETVGLVSHDLGSSSELKDLSRQSLSNTYGSARSAYLRERASMKFEQRVEFLGRLRGLKEAEAANDAFFDNVAEGAKAIGVAHAKLAEAVKQKRSDLNLKGLAAAIGEVADRAKSTREFYQKLKAAEKAATAPAS